MRTRVLPLPSEWKNFHLYLGFCDKESADPWLGESVSDVSTGDEGGLSLWDDDAFRQRVSEIAQMRGLSIAEVCRRAGLSASYLAKPAGKSGRSIEALLGIAHALEISLIELIGTVRFHDTSPTDDNIARLAIIADISAHLYVALGARRQIPSGMDIGQLIRNILRLIELPPLPGE